MKYRNLRQQTMTKLFRILSLAAALVCAAAASAQMRPVLSAYTLEAGSSHLADTYLSPLKYSGFALALNYERMQAMKFDPSRWVMRMNARVGFESAQNPARNASMLDLDLSYTWGMMRRFNFSGGWSVLAGGSTGIDGGVFYNARNSNNPASAKCAWTVNAVAGALYNGRLRGIPFCARYMAELPLTGVFFGPQYGELYYEIYLGDHSKLAHCAWPGNFFRLDNLATVDLRFGATVLRLGYRCAILSTKEAHLVTRRVTHTAVIGVASEWISLSADRSDGGEHARVISAMY